MRKVEEAVRFPPTFKCPSKVDDAFTKIPAEVLVGVMMFVAKSCQAPDCPEQGVVDKRPLVSTCTQRVLAPMRFRRVTAPSTKSVDEAFNPPLIVNPEANVEEALLWKVVPTVRVSMSEVVALSPPLTVNPEAKVEDA